MPRQRACWARSTACRRRPRRSAKAVGPAGRSPAIRAAAISLLPALVADFLAERPGVSVRLISRHSDVVSQLLPTESYDIGIAELPVDETAVRLSALPDALRGDPAAAAPAGRAQGADAGAAVGPAHGGAGALAADADAGSTAPLPRPARRSTRWSRPNFSPACAAWSAAGTGWSLVDPLSATASAILGLVVRPFEPADDLRYRRLPPPRPRAVDAGRGLPRIARFDKLGSLR